MLIARSAWLDVDLAITSFWLTDWLIDWSNSQRLRRQRGWLAMLPQRCDGAGRHPTFTPGANANIVEGELDMRASERATNGAHVRPLLDAARVWCQSRVDELTPLLRRLLGRRLFTVATAHRLVELLDRAVCLEQLNHDAVLVDGKSSIAPMCERRAAIQLVVRPEESVSSQVNRQLVTVCSVFRPATWSSVITWSSRPQPIWPLKISNFQTFESSTSQCGNESHRFVRNLSKAAYNCKTIKGLWKANL